MKGFKDIKTACSLGHSETFALAHFKNCMRERRSFTLGLRDCLTTRNSRGNHREKKQPLRRSSSAREFNQNYFWTALT